MTVFAFYGDDFTGSVDVLLQHRRAGLDGVLVTSVDALSEPDAASAPVVGIAGIARSLPTERLADEVAPAFDALAHTGARVLQYKVCSTADSSERIGSIGRVIELGRDRFGDRPVVASFAQPDFGRYTVFSHHFAREGDTVYRLDLQPTMRAHPVTPATESDLRLHLGAQTDLPIGGLAWSEYEQPAAVRERVSRGPAIVVADALTDDHLDALADAILADADGSAPRFVVGSGGISGALGRRAETATRLPPLAREAAPASPVLVLSGSVSSRTAEQIAASGWPVLDAFAPGAAEAATAAIRDGHDVIVSTASASDAVTPDEVAAALSRVGAAVLATRVPGRLLLCGGDTSGAVLRRLGYHRLSILAQPWGNVALLAAEGPAVPRIELVLKGGQMGDRDLFAAVRAGTSAAIPVTDDPHPRSPE